MQDVKDVVVRCLKCKKISRLKILNGNQIMYIDHMPIIACRFRPDGQWGFECVCGNDSRLAREEKKDIKMLVQGGEHVIKKILKTIDVQPEKKFKMENA